MVTDTQITSWRHSLVRWTDLFSWHEQSTCFPGENNDNPMVRLSHRAQMQSATGSFMQCGEDSKNRWDVEVIWFKLEVRCTVPQGRRRLSKGSYYQVKWKILPLPIFSNWAENLGSCWSFCKCIWNTMVSLAVLSVGCDLWIGQWGPASRSAWQKEHGTRLQAAFAKNKDTATLSKENLRIREVGDMLQNLFLPQFLEWKTGECVVVPLTVWTTMCHTPLSPLHLTLFMKANSYVPGGFAAWGNVFVSI